MNKKKPLVRVAKAQYTPSDIPDYSGNPLVEALPPQLAPHLLKQRLTVMPTSYFIEGMPRKDREDHLEKIFRARLISTQHLDLYLDIYNLVRHGYLHRNPLRSEVMAWSYDIADPNLNNADVIQPMIESTLVPSVADAMFLTGFSGNGKSTMTRHILFNMLPTVTEHTLLNFDEPQVVYLHVDMPHDASRSALILRLLTELDRVLAATTFGDPGYRKVVTKKNGDLAKIDFMLNVLITALNRHHVGVLVIDEFQNMLVASKRFRTETLQMFDELANQLFIPTLKIGTPDSLSLFDNNSRHKRRVGRPFELSRLNEQQVWNDMLNMLYGFQPLKHVIERNEKIDALLLTLTAAVPAYTLGLWKATLLNAIRLGKERITESLIKQTFKQHFPLLRSATRNINLGKKGGYADLLTVQQYLDMNKNSTALKHLENFIESNNVKGAAATDVINDITDAVDTHNFTATQTKKLESLKSKLAKKAQEKLGPQTLEHKP